MTRQNRGAVRVQHYEYKIVPAPARGQKAPGIKGAEARFAHGLETAINALARDGWDYLRADILPSEERHGLTSSHIVYRSVLVFRRAVAQEAATGLVREARPEASPEAAPVAAPVATPVAPAPPAVEEAPESAEDGTGERAAPTPPAQGSDRAPNPLSPPSDNSKQD